jgi:hypothetical protein
MKRNPTYLHQVYYNSKEHKLDAPELINIKLVDRDDNIVKGSFMYSSRSRMTIRAAAIKYMEMNNMLVDYWCTNDIAENIHDGRNLGFFLYIALKI